MKPQYISSPTQYISSPTLPSPSLARFYDVCVTAGRPNSIFHAPARFYAKKGPVFSLRGDQKQP
jgi:hypothetical protein